MPQSLNSRKAGHFCCPSTGRLMLSTWELASRSVPMMSSVIVMCFTILEYVCRACSSAAAQRLCGKGVPQEWESDDIALALHRTGNPL